MAHYQNHVQRMMQECRYSQAGPAKNDVINMMSHYSDLKPTQEWFTFNNGAKKQLVCISGTIPVSYRGAVYNIPVAIYVMENHPATAPYCYVKPTASMQVRHGKHVDASGRIYLPYLSDWRPGRHDLTGLVQVMTIVFGEEPPVVSKPAAGSQRPPYPGANPPYPQPGGPGYPPRGPPSTTYQPTHPPYPMPGGSQPPYPSNPTPGYPQNTPYPAYPPTMYPPGPQQTTPYPPNPAAAGMQNQITDDMIKASLKTAVNDKLKRRMRDAHTQAQSELSSLKQTEKELRDGQEKLKTMISKLEREITQVSGNISTLETKNKEMEGKIGEMQNKQEELDVDEVVLPTTPLYKQILESFAEEQALEDTIYFLGEGLRKGSVDLDSFLKHVRALSRQQFVLRATIKKARATAGLANIY